MPNIPATPPKPTMALVEMNVAPWLIAIT